MTDREKLAREMYVLHWGGDNWETTAQSRRDVFLACADIAIASADRRVAEALRAAEEAVDDARMGEENGLWANAILGIRAISPAREGGQGDE